jgi:hypothetical protein
VKTLKNLTNCLLVSGCVKPKKERNYPRAAGYREPLVSAWLPTNGRNKANERKADAEAVFVRLREQGFELTHTSYEYSTGEPTRLWVQAKVALAEDF